MRPGDVEVDPIAPDDDLSYLLWYGRTDAFVSSKPPSCYLASAPHVGRRIPDRVAVEREYYTRTGVFPIMHLAGIRRELAARHPKFCNAVSNAFEDAKHSALYALESYISPEVSLPWAPAQLAEVRALMGATPELRTSSALCGDRSSSAVHGKARARIADASRRSVRARGSRLVTLSRLPR